jgi:hypothetical protein
MRSLDSGQVRPGGPNWRNRPARKGLRTNRRRRRTDLLYFLGGDGHPQVAEFALKQPQTSIEIRAAQVNRTAIEFSNCPWFQRQRLGWVSQAQHFAVFEFQ